MSIYFQCLFLSCVVNFIEELSFTFQLCNAKGTPISDEVFTGY